MKRYRIFSFDFDTRVYSLTEDIRDEWEESVKENHRSNRRQIEQNLIESFGAQSAEAKQKNFIALGPKPMSIVAYHNRFFEQIRVAFITGAYYPALTAACALGERLLNYLILHLRDDFRNTPEYKKVYRKDSFDNWDTPIETLAAWNVLLPEAIQAFGRLKLMRHDALHFRQEVDRDDRQLALDAILCIGEVISQQFGAWGRQPWFLGIPGEIYVKKDWESNPFVRKIYLPNSLLVGPYHKVESVIPWKIVDDFQYENREINDEEFCDLRKSMRG
jgi:hypothetical protein